MAVPLGSRDLHDRPHRAQRAARRPSRLDDRSAETT